METRIPAFTIRTLVAVMTLILSVSAHAHHGPSHTIAMLDWVLLLAGFAGIGRGFYCLVKAKNLQLQHQSQQKVM